MNKVAIVFGCGGHRAQANRFYNIFSQDKEIQFFSVTDDGLPPAWCSNFLLLEQLRDKYNGKYISPIRFVFNIHKAAKFLTEHNITTIVSFGPGVAIFVAIAARIKGCTIIHFETWSKFSSPSLTTKYMRFLTRNIFIQNAELINVIPYGKFVGRF